MNPSRPTLRETDLSPFPRSISARALLAALALTGLLSHATAQTTTPTTPGTDEMLVLEPLVVTAQHRAQRLQDVPISMSVVRVNRETAENTHADTN